MVPCDMATLTRAVRSAFKEHRGRQSDGARRRRLGKIFQDTMVAATFAQAGEFETAREFLVEESEEGPSLQETAARGRVEKRRPEHLEEEPA